MCEGVSLWADLYWVMGFLALAFRRVRDSTMPHMMCLAWGRNGIPDYHQHSDDRCIQKTKKNREICSKDFCSKEEREETNIHSFDGQTGVKSAVNNFVSSMQSHEDWVLAFRNQSQVQAEYDIDIMTLQKMS